MTKTLVVPMILYLVGTSLLGTEFFERLGPAAYPWGYAAVVVVCLAAIGFLLPPDRRKIFEIHPRILPGVLVGLVGIVIWIAISHLQLEQRLAVYLPSFLQPGERIGYNPFEHLSRSTVWLFIAVRIIGIAVVVPLAEELFWRGFLLRWLIDADWEKVPIGRYTPGSCALVTLLFTLSHPEWIAAAIYCLLLNVLLYRTKDLWQCIVAHAVSNLILAIYVLATDNWWLW